MAKPALEHGVQAGHAGHDRHSYPVTPGGCPFESQQWPPRQHRAVPLGPDSVNVYMPAVADEPVEQRAAAQQLQRLPAHGLADDDLRDVLLAGNAQQAARDVVVRSGDDLTSQLTRKRQVAAKPGLLILGQSPGQLDVHRQPARMQFAGQPPRPAHERGRGRARAHRDQQPLAGLPGVAHPERLPVGQHILAHVLGGKSQRQLAQRRQIARTEEVLLRCPG